MAHKKDHHADDAPQRSELKKHGVGEEHHDEVLALRAPLAQRGVNWARLVDILVKVGNNAPAVISLIKDILSHGDNPPPTDPTGGPQAGQKK